MTRSRRIWRLINIFAHVLFAFVAGCAVLSLCGSRLSLDGTLGFSAAVLLSLALLVITRSQSKERRQ